MVTMTESSKRAGSYLRISYDQEGLELGVDRQREDNGKKAAEKGWTVAREYIDNDLSAYSGVARPGFQQMVKRMSETGIATIAQHHRLRLRTLTSEARLPPKLWEDIRALHDEKRPAPHPGYYR